MVGAVIVRDGEIVGRGYHIKVGEDHAEAMALKEAGEKARGARLYVNLEPCNHFGRTPPCTHAIVKGGIQEVVIGMADPNPHVSGGGISFQREKGIRVVVGVLERECFRLNEAFCKYVTTGRPFVVMKTACSLDGKIATGGGDSKWITGEASRRFVHQLRHASDAILIGIGTVFADDPLLTTRLPGKRGKDPLRVVVDTHLNMPLAARCLHLSSKAKTVVAASSMAQKDRVKALEKEGAEVLPIPTHEMGIDLDLLMDTLGKRGITSVLIEGGGRIHASALKMGIVDKIMIFYAPKLIGGKEAPAMVAELGVDRIRDAIKIEGLRVRKFQEDFMLEGYVSSA
jgi:diaminohydroxyphosphoribosylaminopyrimidine deaminase/5-amino-6-(5-phosphoribosylamino)uracil reductase